MRQSYDEPERFPDVLIKFTTGNLKKKKNPFYLPYWLPSVSFEIKESKYGTISAQM